MASDKQQRDAFELEVPGDSSARTARQASLVRRCGDCSRRGQFVLVVVAVSVALMLGLVFLRPFAISPAHSFAQIHTDNPTQCHQTTIANPIEGRAERCRDVKYIAEPRSHGELNITIASSFALQFMEMDFVWENHMKYARTHSLNYFAPVCNDAFQYGIYRRSHCQWLKYPIIQYLFDAGADAVFWMDGDSVFVNNIIDIRVFLAMEPLRDLTFSGDLNEVFNAGHFMLRKTDWAETFLKQTFKICISPMWHDQGAMMAFLGGADPNDDSTWKDAEDALTHACKTAADAEKDHAALPDTMQGYVRVLEWRAMNCYDYTDAELIPLGWKDCLVMHAAGYPFNDKLWRLRDWARAATSVDPTAGKQLLI